MYEIECRQARCYRPRKEEAPWTAMSITTSWNRSVIAKCTAIVVATTAIATASATAMATADATMPTSTASNPYRGVEYTTQHPDFCLYYH